MDGDAGEALVMVLSVETAGQQQAAQLGVVVLDDGGEVGGAGTEVKGGRRAGDGELREPVALTGHRHHSRGGAAQEKGEQEVGEVEVGEIVHLHHLLKPILRHIVAGQVDSSIEDEIVELAVSHSDHGGKPLDGLQAGKVQLQAVELSCRAVRSDLQGRPLCPGQVPASEDDSAVLGGESQRCLVADPSTRPRHQGSPPREVEAMHHLTSGGAGVVLLSELLLAGQLPGEGQTRVCEGRPLVDVVHVNDLLVLHHVPLPPKGKAGTDSLPLASPLQEILRRDQGPVTDLGCVHCVLEVPWLA